MASPKLILEKMIAAMNRGGDAARKAVLKSRDIETFAKPTPKKKKRVVKKPAPAAGAKSAGKPRRKAPKPR